MKRYFFENIILKLLSLDFQSLNINSYNMDHKILIS